MSDARPDARGFAVFAALPIAALLGLMSATGLVHPAIYGREAPAWFEQAVGQNWFDLVVTTPLLVICAIGARTGSRTWRVLLAGTYAYVAYELVIYTFALHFNALFLVYCATLGLATFALIAMLGQLRNAPVVVVRQRARLGGGFLIALGSVFAALWLLEDVPAILRGAPSATLVETGLATNPVHVIDLAFVLPTHILVGVWLLRGRPPGELYGPVILAFGVPMSMSIGTMMVVMLARGEAAPVPVIAAMFTVAIATAAVLARVLGGVSATRSPRRDSPLPSTDVLPG